MHIINCRTNKITKWVIYYKCSSTSSNTLFVNNKELRNGYPLFQGYYYGTTAIYEAKLFDSSEEAERFLSKMISNDSGIISFFTWKGHRLLVFGKEGEDGLPYTTTYCVDVKEVRVDIEDGSVTEVFDIEEVF